MMMYYIKLGIETGKFKVFSFQSSRFLIVEENNGFAGKIYFLNSFSEP